MSVKYLVHTQLIPEDILDDVAEAMGEALTFEHSVFRLNGWGVALAYAAVSGPSEEYLIISDWLAPLIERWPLLTFKASPIG